MNLLQPDRLQALAREHALGTLTGGARRRFDRLLQDSAEARAALALWQSHFAALAASVPPLQPRPQVWQGLRERLSLPPAALNQPGVAGRAGWWGRLQAGLVGGVRARVMGGVVGGVLAGLLGATVLLQANPGWLGHEVLTDGLPASYVGLLSDAAGRPTVLLSARRQGRVLSAKLLQALAPPPGQVAMLWAFPKGGAPAFLVGVLPERGASKLTLPDTAEKLFFTVDRLGVGYAPAGSLPAAPQAGLAVSGPCVKLW